MIYITGDKHGEWQGVMDFCDEHETTEDDVMIVLGDAGINYLQDWRDCQLKWALSRLPITILCIHGNHEERPENIRSYREKEWNGGQVFYEEDFPNLLFAKDGGIYDLNGKSALTIGGAYSVDKWFRQEYGDHKGPKQLGSGRWIAPVKWQDEEEYMEHGCMDWVFGEYFQSGLIYHFRTESFEDVDHEHSFQAVMEWACEYPDSFQIPEEYLHEYSQQELEYLDVIVKKMTREVQGWQQLKKSPMARM